MVWNSVSPIENQVFVGFAIVGAARGGSVTIQMHGSNVHTATKDAKVGSVKAEFRPAVPVRALFGVQGVAWGVVSINTDGSINLVHRYGADSLVWSSVDISVTYTI